MPAIGAMMGTVFHFFFLASTFTPSTKCKKKANETKIFLCNLEQFCNYLKKKFVNFYNKTAEKKNVENPLKIDTKKRQGP